MRRLVLNLRHRLTYANVMASIALFVALGGTSYGLAAGSIDSREIKNNTIRSKDIRNNEVRGADVRESTFAAVPRARSAATADLLDGLDSAAFLRTDTAAGGDLSGSYAAPTLRDSAVTTAKLAPGAVTPDKSTGLVRGIAGARATLVLGGGGDQHVLDVPGFGTIRGGCGSGAAGLRLFNQSGITLEVAVGGPGTGVVEDVVDGASSSLSGPGVGAAGIQMIQASGGSGNNARALTVLGTSAPQASNQCPVQVHVTTSLP